MSKMSPCRRDDGSSMLSRIRQSTPLSPPLLPSHRVSYRVCCSLRLYVFAEGEESSRRELRGFMGFMG